MAQLSNQKHERFAQELAVGCSQSESGRRAGFVSATSNKSYLSKLAQRVASRVAEIRRDNAIAGFNNRETAPNTSGKSLEELGFTKIWVAEQYLAVHARGLAIGDMKNSTESVRLLEKLIRSAEAEGGETPKKAGGPKIDVDHMMAILSKLAAPSVQLGDDQKHTAEDPPEVSKMARNRAHRAAARDE